MAPKERDYIVNLDSSTRDVATYPNANDYVLPLDNVIPSVKKITVNYAFIPNSEYAVNQDNRYLNFTKLGVPYTIKLGDDLLFDSNENGGYNPTPTELADEILAKVNTAAASTLTAVTYVENTMKFTFDWATTQTVVFQFNTGLDKEKSAALLMGYNDNTDYTFTLPSLADTYSPNVTQLGGPPELLMVLGDGGDEFTQIIGPQKESEFRVTARFPLKCPSGSYEYYKENGEFPLVYNFYEGSKFSLNELHVKIYKARLGKLIPYNFNGLDHNIQLEILGYTDKMMINEDYSKDIRLVELPPPIDENLTLFDYKNIIEYLIGFVLIVGFIIIAKQSRRT